MSIESICYHLGWTTCYTTIPVSFAEIFVINRRERAAKWAIRATSQLVDSITILSAVSLAACALSQVNWQALPTTRFTPWNRFLSAAGHFIKTSGSLISAKCPSLGEIGTTQLELLRRLGHSRFHGVPNCKLIQKATACYGLALLVHVTRPVTAKDVASTTQPGDRGWHGLPVKPAYAPRH